MTNDNMTIFPISNLEKNEIQHSSLSESLVERVKAYKKILGNLDPVSLAEALDDFKRDSNPEREVEIWEKIAHTYKVYCDENPNSSFESRKQAYAKALKDSITDSPLVVIP